MATGFSCLSRLRPGLYRQNVTIPKTGGGVWPHLTDFLVPLSGATRCIVGLHGGGGSKSSYPRQLTLSNTSPATLQSINWPLLEYWNTMVVIPQGQACTGVDPVLGAGGNAWNPGDVNTINAANPMGTATWSNEFMWSGANDPAFLIDLVAYINATYSGLTKMALAGHSNGGFMTMRVWHENPTLFDHYLCTSGPPAIYYATATPAGGVYKPIWMQFGSLDNVLDINGGPAGAGDHFYDASWVQNPSEYSVADVTHPGHTESGWSFLQKAVTGLSGQTIYSTDATVTSVAIGTLSSWSYALGKAVCRLLSNAGHPAWQQQQCLGHVGGRYFGSWLQFITTT